MLSPTTTGTFTIKNLKMLVGTFNKEKALIGSFSKLSENYSSGQQWACRADPQLDRVMTVCSARHNAGQWLVDHGGIMGFILEIVDVITHCNYFYCS